MAKHQVEESSLKRIQKLYVKASDSFKVQIAAFLYRLQPEDPAPLTYLVTTLER